MEISVVDLDNSCRVCLVSDLSLESMFSSTFEDMTYFKILNLLVGPITMSLQSSQLICHECKNQVGIY